MVARPGGGRDTVDPCVAAVVERAVRRFEEDPLVSWCLTRLLDVTGHPAASVPAGLIDGRLSVGMQIIGRRHDDVEVLRARSVLERIAP